MKNLINELWSYISTFSWIDILFFALVLLLIITFITMVYLVKMNKKIIIEEAKKEDSRDEIDIKAIRTKLEENEEKMNINYTNYELEQEEEAIISYSELLANAKNDDVKYDEDYYSENQADIEIKKVKSELPKLKKLKEDSSVDYEQELKYLESLKDLNNKLS